MNSHELPAPSSDDNTLSASDTFTPTTSSGTCSTTCHQQPSIAQTPTTSSIKNTEDAASHDIGLYSENNAGLPEGLKYLLLKQPWKPSASYNFPVSVESGRNRKFKLEWLDRFPWLVYSSAKEGAFCKYCVLFANRLPSCGTVGAFVVTPLKKFKRAIEYMESHENASFHVYAAEIGTAFTRSVETVSSVVSMGNMAMKEIIARNRKALQSIVETVIFCGRNNIPLRGHRDDGSLTEVSSFHEGNFWELLRFRISSGDTILEEHVKSAAWNATMISKTTQNDIISICGQLILKQIVDEVKEAQFFSVMADETTDITTAEQMSVLVRYTTPQGVREAFVGFVEVVSTTGQFLADTIWKFLLDIGLDPRNLRGQGYDGASNMSGVRNGVQALIQQKNPLAIYTHCCSHVLNLVIVKSCSVPDIRNMF